MPQLEDLLGSAELPKPGLKPPLEAAFEPATQLTPAEPGPL